MRPLSEKMLGWRFGCYRDELVIAMRLVKTFLPFRYLLALYVPDNVLRRTAWNQAPSFSQIYSYE